MLKQTRIKTLMICAVASLLINQPAFAQINEFKLTASDAAAGDRFGESVSISGDYTIVGAYLDDDAGDSSGSAYIFVRDGQSWTEQAKLTASDASSYGNFGESVSISGDYAIVGAYSGAAYIFVRDGQSWTQQAKLTASDAAGGDVFGGSVSISSDYAIVGAHGDDDGGSGSGSAYIFVRNGESWTEQAKLTASDAAGGDVFGQSVSISGDYAIVGAYKDDDAGSESGSAYIFVRNGESWTEQAKITASDAAAVDWFGVSVSISGDYVIVGAAEDDDGGDRSGSAYIFVRNGESWTEQAKITASDAAAVDWFGVSVSISDGYAIVGAYLDDDSGSASGSAYIFVRDGLSWTEQAKLTASDAAGSDLFGQSVSISRDYAVVGSNGDDDNGSASGSAYIYNNFIPSILINVPADQPTIQAAIDIATDGDTVLVHPGTYTENINFNGKSILVTSLDGADATIIDGNQSGSVVTFTSGEGENSILEGFTITNGSGTNGTEGGGIYCSNSSPSIIHCKIINNTVTNSGGGIYLSGSSPIIYHCTISGNTSGQSGGLRLENSSSPKMTYCMITGNTGQYGGGMSIYSSSSPWLINCTFSGNYASTQGGGLYVHGSGTNPIMVNSFLWDDAAGQSGQEIYICCGPSMTINYSDINPSDITGSVSNLSDNINADPLFVSPLAAGEAPTTGGDYHLSVNSPAIDAATAFFELNNDTLVDLLASEYMGTAPDMGAFEYNLLAPELSVLPDTLNFSDVLVGETLIKQVTVKNIGTADLNVTTITITGVDSLNFSVDATPFTLSIGDSVLLDVSFTPDTTKIFSGLLNIVSDGGNASVSLSGNGIAPEILVTPFAIDFGDVLVGETATEHVMVSNIGTADLNVSLISFTGVDSLNFSTDTTHFVLALGDSLYLEVSFNPNTSGNFNASMVIESDGGTVTISLSGHSINPAPSIVSISDVPDDQGGWVFLSWESSMFDTVGDITQYGVWELNPEDEWVGLGNVPAIQEDEYIYLAHTFDDSTADGIFWSTFMVTAHTTDPEVFYTSAVDSGYSVDNLAPAVPMGLLALVTDENTVVLTWDPPVDEDFNYVKIYRSLTRDFDPTGMEPLAETVETMFIDSDVEIGETYFYRLSAIDVNGNESDFSDEESAEVLSLDEFAGIPDVFALRQNYPNPFNPITTLRYDLPENSYVNIIIYDMLGREVRTLVNQNQDAGFISVIWNATNDHGKPVSAGVYLYQIRAHQKEGGQAGEFVQTKKMILLK